LVVSAELLAIAALRLAGPRLRTYLPYAVLARLEVEERER